MLIAAVAFGASAQVVEYRDARWSDAQGGAPSTFIVVRWRAPWSHAKAAEYAASVGAGLASLPSDESLANATVLCAEPNFWQCAGPWVGSRREASQPWRWTGGQPVAGSSWAPGRPAQAAALPACAMLSGDGAPSGGLHDALDAGFGQPTTSSAILQWETPLDCDGDGLPDPFQISLDPSLDADGDGLLDRCTPRSPDIDASGQVDFGDVALVMLDFGRCDACATDLDWSGTVDFGDVALVMLSFGTVGMPH